MNSESIEDMHSSDFVQNNMNALNYLTLFARLQQNEEQMFAIVAQPIEWFGGGDYFLA